MRAATTIVTGVVILIVWQIWTDATHVPSTLMPSPVAIAQAAGKSWHTLWPALQITGAEGIIGFIIAIAAGIALGVGFHCSRLLHATLLPYLTAAQTLPLIAIAPMFLIWFGFEPTGKVVLVAIFGLFPVAVQTVRGLDSVPRFYEDVALTCGASPAWTLWHVKLRVAARQIFGGIRISAAYTLSTATTAEYLGARKGLGIWLQMAYNSFRTPLIFVAAFAIIIATGILLLLVDGVELALLGNPEDDDLS